MLVLLSLEGRGHHDGMEVYRICVDIKSMSVFSKVLLTVREDGWRTNIGRKDTGR